MKKVIDELRLQLSTVEDENTRLKNRISRMLNIDSNI